MLNIQALSRALLHELEYLADSASQQTKEPYLSTVRRQDLALLSVQQRTLMGDQTHASSTVHLLMVRFFA